LSDEQQAALARFERYLLALHRSPDTRRLYVGTVRRWFVAGGVPGHLDASLLHRELALMRQRCAPSSVNLTLKALRSFYRLQADWGSCSAAEHMRLPRQLTVPKRLVRVLTPEQVGEVLASVPLDTFVGLRDYTIVRLLWESGLRAGEMSALVLGSLLPDGMLFVHGKAQRDRYVPITPEMAGVLDGYMRARGALRPGKKAALWLTRTGRPLANGRSIWEIVQRRIWTAIGRKAGWHAVQRSGRPWQGHYPHELRASFATTLLRNGCPLTAISQLMGHADVATTALYLGLDVEHLRQALSLHPRERQAQKRRADHAAALAGLDECLPNERDC